MKRKTVRILIHTILICLIASATINGQTGNDVNVPEDSLSLDWIIQQIVVHHPVVQSTKEALNQADAQVGLAKSGYYPNIDFSAGLSDVGPVPSLDIPDLGSFSLFPRNNISGEVNVRQNIYDFGRTAQNVAFAGQGKAIAEQSLEQVKQNMALKAVQIYYTLDYLQEAIIIKAEQLETLQEHLDYVQKKEATGSATNYEILSTKVKISGIETQQLDLEATRDIQLSILNSLLGLPTKTYHTVKSVLNIKQPDIGGDSLISHALKNRDEMVIARDKEGLASMHLDAVKLQTKPSLNFIANGGLKNGYIPELNKMRANYVVGLGLNVPIFDATRTKYNLLQAQSAVETSSLQTEITRRNISSEVVANETNIRTAIKEVKQAKMQLEQAQEALTLAQTSYASGVITNLDLLDATTAVSESKLTLLKSQIGYVVNVYKLKASLGERLY